jgi:hypothetical protein
MPPRRPKLSAADLQDLARWIDTDAPYARTLTVPAAAAPEPWAFRPLRPGSLASLDRGSPVDRRRLLRRVTFDLTGLPPTPEEIDTFLRDESPGAYEKVVDRLLASPRYGERWARHWLDVARYSDSCGYESDFDRKSAWPYRDAVIRAFNEDLPFDTFLKFQLAGDQLDREHPLSLPLTGFATCGPEVETTPTDSARNKEKYRMDELDDIVSTMGQAFLGLTVGCARCHDHKYDPISSKEYYQLVAAFAPTRAVELPLDPAERRLREWVESRRETEREARLAAIPIPEIEKVVLRAPRSPNHALSVQLYNRFGEKLTVSDVQLRATLSEAERKTWDELSAAAKGGAANVLALVEGAPRKTWRLARGDVDEKQEEVTPSGFRVLEGRPDRDWSRPRVALGEWMTDVEKGAGRLVARVAVNRLWQHHFGHGLVGTPNDFGAQGEAPTDPELLDGLARALIDNGWRLKPLQRRIVLSARYQSARRPVRLEAEAVRDAVLAVSGRLNPTMYGPATRIRIPADAIATRSKNEYPKNVVDGPEQWRRSVYVFLKRSVRVPFFEVYDAPAASASCGRRSCTTVAPQALLLLNDPFIRDAAKEFARRAGGVDAAFRLALGRPPSSQELEAARRLDLVDLCHVLFTLNEFVYVD